MTEKSSKELAHWSAFQLQYCQNHAMYALHFFEDELLQQEVRKITFLDAADN
jgi:hypothetical protein